jgi:plasmid maintenance system antidote protein VapI
MANNDLIKAYLAERGIKRRFVAQKMKISDKRLSVILNGGKWKLDEVISFTNALSLTKKQRDEFFFS